MNRLPLPGFWYGEACIRPNGTRGFWASPLSGARVYTEGAAYDIEYPLLYTRGYRNGVFAGQASAPTPIGNWECREVAGDKGHLVGDGYGENTVLYLRDGTLVQGAPHYGAQGLRYQDDAGNVVTADNSHLSPDGLMADYTELHGIRIGQDQQQGLGALIQVLDRPGGTGELHILERGPTEFIRFNFYEPNLIAFYCVKLSERTAVAIWLTTDEIAGLEKYPAPIEPIPIPPEPTPEPPGPNPKPEPVPPATGFRVPPTFKVGG